MTIQTLITGHIGNDPTLRCVEIPNKDTQAVLNFSVQAAPRRFNKHTSEWETINKSSSC